jgi:hypothetical protein
MHYARKVTVLPGFIGSAPVLVSCRGRFITREEMARISTFSRPFTHTHTHVTNLVGRAGHLFGNKLLSAHSFIIRFCFRGQAKGKHASETYYWCFIPVAECCSPEILSELFGSEHSVASLLYCDVFLLKISDYSNAETEIAMRHLWFIAENSRRVVTIFRP